MRTSAPLALLLLSTAAAHATSYVMVSDEDLVRQAPLIVEARVAGAQPAPTLRPATDYFLEVERLLKGDAGGSDLVLRVPGGTTPDGLELILHGAPRLVQGERLLLFLHPGREGTWRSLHLMLGAFHRLETGGRQLAARNLSGAIEVGAGGELLGERTDLARDFVAFREWIGRRAAGVPASADYFVALPESASRELEQKFSHIRFQDTPTRWFDFDHGGSVVWRAEAGGQPGSVDGGFAEVQQALAAWTTEPGSSIRLHYGGTTGSGAGFSSPDGQNVVHFADPHDDIETDFACGTGGVLAIGGPWAVPSARRSFQGRNYVPILEGDIITNKGIECFILNRSSALAEILTHEVGHTLGLGHSCGDSKTPACFGQPVKNSAVMRASAHNDGRGASLGIDDVAAVRFLYATGDDCSGGSAAGGRTLCLHGGRFRLEVNWENQFNGTQGAGAAIPSSDLAGFFYFDDPRNVELMVKLLDFGDRILFFSGQLTNLLFGITVTDTFTGEVKLYQNGPNNCGEIDGEAFPGTGSAGAGPAAGSSPLFGELAPGTGISHGILLAPPRDRQGALEPEGLTAASTRAHGSCHPSAHRLCLLGGRIAVELAWRNQFNDASGAGRAETLSDLTGSFSFDDPQNLEVLVKALDFGDRILVLWGALSNLEYALEVTDLASGASKRYENPAGTYCGGLDEAAF